MQKPSSDKGRSPPQELEEGLRSGPPLLVTIVLAFMALYCHCIGPGWGQLGCAFSTVPSPRPLNKDWDSLVIICFVPKQV